MSEQKYYVKLIQTGLMGSEERFQLYLWKHGGRYSYSSKVYEEEHRTANLDRFQFTKSELAEIIPDFETNSLIKLVPVEVER